MEWKSSVKLLDGDNYATWKVQVKMCLIKDDLWRIVNGDEVAPTEAGALVKFNIRKDRALAIIVLAVDQKLLYLLGDPVDPVAVWKKLQDTFQKRTWANKLRLKKKLYALRLSNNGDLQVHLKKMVEIFEALSIVGTAVEEEDQVICLLASLPEKYDTIVTTLETLDAVPGWNAVTERLIREEEKKQEQDDNDQKAFVTGRFKSIKCYGCGKTGHIKRYCPSRRCENAAYAHEKTMQKEEEEDIVLTALATGRNDPKYDGNFILDSACTQHMCNDSEMFENLIKTGEKKVKVGDGQLLNVCGGGDVIFDLKIRGGKVSKCRLKNVLYVPKLSHNLISVPQVSKRGMDIVFYRDGCNILRGKKTLASASRMGDLYILDGSIMLYLH